MKFNQKIIDNFKIAKMSENIKVKVTADKEKIRFTIPAKEVRRINAKTSDYVKVNIKKDKYEINYYVSIPSMPSSRTNLQVKRNIPKNFVKKANLKAEDLVDLRISLVENKRSTQLIKDNKLDILAVIPEKTKASKLIMVDLFKKNNKEYCKVWYCSGQGGNAKPIELKRYIKIDRLLGEFFGLMQAESRKNGYKFDFTNNLISEHKLFMRVAERFGISNDLWKYELFYNPAMSKEYVKKQVSIFQKTLSINKKIIFVESKTLSKVALTIYIDCNILAKIMISIMLMLRSKVANSIDTKELREFTIGFICKDLLGDGTVICNTTRGCINIEISEQDLLSQKDITNILSNLGIGTRISKNKIFLNINMAIYLWLLQNKAFAGHRNRRKLINSILSNYYVRSLYNRFRKNISYTSSQFAKEHNLLLSTAQMFLRRNTIRGFLVYDKNKRLNVYKLSTKGQSFMKTIKDAEKELTTLL